MGVNMTFRGKIQEANIFANQQKYVKYLKPYEVFMANIEAGNAESLSANMIWGVARLVIAFGDNLQDDVFKEKVGQHSARSLSRIAKERNAGTRGYAEAMLDIYNRMMKKGALKWSRLHAITSGSARSGTTNTWHSGTTP